MNSIPSDIILNICNFLVFRDLIALSCTCRYFHRLLNSMNDSFWKQIAYKMFSETFWIKASMRPVYTSKPLHSYKKELIRLLKFEKYIGEALQESDYYSFWNSLDSIKIRKDIGDRLIDR